MNESTADVFAQALRSSAPPARGDKATTNAATSYACTGGFLVCLDVPDATEFGIDYEVFRTGPKFQGVKFVPKGVHFVVFRSREHEHGIRQGFFLNVEYDGQVLVREWSAEKEELGPPRPGLNIEHLTDAVHSFQLDRGLGPYPKQHYKTWQRLSCYITHSVLKRCGIELGTLILPGDAAELPSSNATPENVVAPYFADAPRTVRFTPLARRGVHKMTTQERTAYLFDKRYGSRYSNDLVYIQICVSHSFRLTSSKMLEELLETSFEHKWTELLGEFQLAFVVFLQLSSLAALEQWKQVRACAGHLTLCNPE
ncbi:hypothetical protein PINS_up015380 [Pythium insidiosum]|nr:hypothetical protein PINS_up015380 [Pythium insidiosum]